LYSALRPTSVVEGEISLVVDDDSLPQATKTIARTQRANLALNIWFLSLVKNEDYPTSMFSTVIDNGILLVLSLILGILFAERPKNPNKQLRRRRESKSKENVSLHPDWLQTAITSLELSVQRPANPPVFG
jgi:hypothetical protein